MSNKKLNFPAFVACVLVLVASFLPLASLGEGGSGVSLSISLISDITGILMVLLALITGFMIYEEYKWTFLFSTLIGVLGIIDIIRISGKGENWKIGLGVFLAIAASTGIATLTFKYFKKKPK